MNDSVYESIMTGLNEAIEDATSKKPILKRQKVTVEPVKVYEAEDVKRIRNTTGMSQKTFASYMGVSDKTVEAWESGTNHPSGAASRILNMMEIDKDLVIKFPFVSNVQDKKALQ
ncbi:MULTISPECIES: helix-turn-helix domain-containing protein [unclassified Butyrivibrio]|uniref:helix-turn-helix domain-containing protein n=1 Tax=unclassified Butyrivibrio TaxID=2639466 RepID=UPI0004030212|nr:MULTISPECIES: helix-turn-helix domain-containing protein [unclassified Butyrivibrio]MBE5837928.1 helix-turn-helix domain-containing protein [Butyrivibrio sp.]SDB64575.1 putative transcriptional regulator [Butyrivibrio sp. INlla16]